jgi:hypothetical protein
LEKVRRVPISVSSGPDPLVLQRGPLLVEIGLRPFSFTVRRRGRRLLRAGGLWVADGTIYDHFVQFTEGVVAREELSPTERALRAEIARRDEHQVSLALTLQGGQIGRAHV